MRKVMVRSFNEVVRAKKEFKDITMRGVAMVLALKRVIRAFKLRGPWPQ